MICFTGELQTIAARAGKNTMKNKNFALNYLYQSKLTEKRTEGKVLSSNNHLLFYKHKILDRTCSSTAVTGQGKNEGGCMCVCVFVCCYFCCACLVFGLWGFFVCVCVFVWILDIQHH